jgi:hypothetical protein
MLDAMMIYLFKVLLYYVCVGCPFMNVSSELILGKMLPTTVVIVLRPFFGESRGRSGEWRVRHRHASRASLSFLYLTSVCLSFERDKGITLQNLFAKKYTRFVLLITVRIKEGTAPSTFFRPTYEGIVTYYLRWWPGVP